MQPDKGFVTKPKPVTLERSEASNQAQVRHPLEQNRPSPVLGTTLLKPSAGIGLVRFFTLD